MWGPPCPSERTSPALLAHTSHEPAGHGEAVAFEAAGRRRLPAHLANELDALKGRCWRSRFAAAPVFAPLRLRRVPLKPGAATQMQRLTSRAHLGPFGGVRGGLQRDITRSLYRPEADCPRPAYGEGEPMQLSGDLCRGSPLNACEDAGHLDGATFAALGKETAPVRVSISTVFRPLPSRVTESRKREPSMRSEERPGARDTVRCW